MEQSASGLQRTEDGAPNVRRSRGTRASRVVAGAVLGALVVVAAVATGRSLLLALPTGVLVGLIAVVVSRPLHPSGVLSRIVWMSGRTRARFIELVARLLVSVVALWAVLNIVLNPNISGSRYAPETTSYYDPPTTALIVVTVLAGLPAFWRWCVAAGARLRDRRQKRRTRTVALVIALLVIAVQFLIGWSTAKLPGFDAGIITSSSFLHEFPVGADHGDASYYYIALPNNLVLGFGIYVLAHVLGILGITSFATFMTALIWINCLILDLGAVLLLGVARRLSGDALALFLVPPVLLFVVFSPWLNTLYSDTIGLTLVIAITWSWMRARALVGRRRSTAFILIGVLAGVGYSIKPTVLAVVLVLAVAELVTAPPSLQQRTWGAVPRVFAAGVVLVAITQLLVVPVALSGFVSFDPFHNKDALPITEFMEWGAHGTGGYNADDAARNWTQPADARFAFHLNRYFDIVQETGLFNYVLFLGNKALWMLGDGSFYQGREGDGTLTYLRSDTVSQSVQSVFALDGSNHVVIATVWQAGWIVALILLALGVVVPTALTHLRWATVMRAALVLLFLFLLFAEGRSRYLYLYLPLILLLGAMTFSSAVPRARLARRTLAAAIGMPRGGPPVRSLSGSTARQVDPERGDFETDSYRGGAQNRRGRCERLNEESR